MSTAGQAGEAVLVRERARLLAPVHVPVEPPRRRVGYVDRVDLVRRLSEAQETVALVVAPAGYGKTTLLTQYAVTEERPVAWLALSEPDNDPPSLLAHLLLALDGIETTEPSAFDAIVFSQAE
ncbi:MAG TPA: hypothetical protein VEP49_11955, partial [Acidimicrobiia bacterium]|nr:hypothetical protein [Acidimicrobiia bacterium]